MQEQKSAKLNVKIYMYELQAAVISVPAAVLADDWARSLNDKCNPLWSAEVGFKFAVVQVAVSFYVAARDFAVRVSKKQGLLAKPRQRSA